MANACVGAAHAVCHLHKELWITAHKQSKCGLPPHQLMLQDHSAKAKAQAQAKAQAKAALGDTFLKLFLFLLSAMHQRMYNNNFVCINLT